MIFSKDMITLKGLYGFMPISILPKVAIIKFPTYAGYVI
tara:strand:- start:215 stop:331 length:117 start_codon:yes stop_codon:yes gene_type:complete